MKLLTLSLLLTMSAFANPDLERRILKLEQRVAQLERQIAQKPHSGLKVKDMGGGKIKAQQSPQMPALTPEQRKQIMQQLEQFKKSQSENQKILDELMNEN
jgi:hypothetical protein